MFKHKRLNEGMKYEPPTTRNKITDDVNNELAGVETFFNRHTRLKISI